MSINTLLTIEPLLYSDVTSLLQLSVGFNFAYYVKPFREQFTKIIGIASNLYSDYISKLDFDIQKFLDYSSIPEVNGRELDLILEIYIKQKERLKVKEQAIKNENSDKVNSDDIFNLIYFIFGSYSLILLSFFEFKHNFENESAYQNSIVLFASYYLVVTVIWLIISIFFKKDIQKFNKMFFLIVIISIEIFFLSYYYNWLPPINIVDQKNVIIFSVMITFLSLFLHYVIEMVNFEILKIKYYFFLLKSSIVIKLLRSFSILK